MSVLSVVHILFFLGIVFSSLYVFPSGNPQPTDFLLAIASISILLSSSLRISSVKLLWPMIFLTIWVSLVSMVWLIIYPQGLFFKPPLFFAFNLLVMLAIVNLFDRLDNPRKFFAIAVQYALLISGLGVVFSLFFPGTFLASESLRITGFFNNPNQLAYFNLCMLAALIILRNGHLRIVPLELVAVASGIFGIIVASSLGALAGLIAIFISALLGSIRNVKGFIRFLSIFLLLLYSIYSFDIYHQGLISDRLDTRFNRLDTKVSQIESERKYDRILAFPEYWVFGAGEGATERFLGHEGGEIHSSLGNLLFSYGVLGLGLFMFILWRAIRHAPLYAWFALAGPMLYSITHMGLRSTTFWMLIAFILICYVKRQRRIKVSKDFNLRSQVHGEAQ